jgi:hypothetical protein
MGNLQLLRDLRKGRRHRGTYHHFENIDGAACGLYPAISCLLGRLRHYHPFTRIDGDLKRAALGDWQTVTQL